MADSVFVVEPLPIPGPLTVLVGGEPIGIISVSERYAQTVYGKFKPLPGIEPYRALFEAALELAAQFDATPQDGPCDYQLWDELMSAYRKLNTLSFICPEFACRISSLEVEGDWNVQIGFESPAPGPGLLRDRCGQIIVGGVDAPHATT